MENIGHNLNIYSNPEEISELLEMPEVISALGSYLDLPDQVIVEALELRRDPFAQIQPEEDGPLQTYRFGYRNFTITKPDGHNFREINDSAPSLKLIQQRLLQKLYAHELSPSATGCVPGRGLRDNILPHLGKGYILKFDVKSAFENTTAQMVADALDDFLNKAIQEERTFDNPNFAELTDYEVDKFKQAIVTLVVKNDELPQGAPTSPYLFNMVFQSVDDEINSFLDFVETGAYTRYVDDLLISFKAFKDFFLPWQSMGDINKKLEQVIEFYQDPDRALYFCIIQEMVDTILLELVALAHTTYFNSDEIHVQYLLGRLQELEDLFRKVIDLSGIPRYPGVENVFDAIFRFRKRIESLKLLDSVGMIQQEIEEMTRRKGLELNPQKTKIWTPADNELRDFTGVKLDKEGRVVDSSSRLRGLLPFE